MPGDAQHHAETQGQSNEQGNNQEWTFHKSNLEGSERLRLLAFPCRLFTNRRG
jgi:hypothetical protein